MFSHWSLRFRVFLFFLFLGIAALAVIAGGLWFGYSRATPGTDPSAFVLSGLAAGFAVLGLVAWIWRLFDENLAHPMQALAAQMRVLAAGKGGAPLPAEEAKYLGDLAPAARAISERLSETQTDLALAIQRETQVLADEKERLEALLSDVSVGILLCDGHHNVVFYNSLARGLLEGCAPPRLDQPVTNCLRPGPISGAYEQLTVEGATKKEAQFLCNTADGTMTFEATMRLVPQGNNEAGGYVLSLKDVTAQSSAAMARESLLTDMVDNMRRRAAGLETLVGLSGAKADDPLTTALVDETRAFAGSVSEFAARFETSRAQIMPGRSVSAQNLAQSTASRLRSRGLVCTTACDDLTLAGEGVMLTGLMGHLAERLKSELDVLSMSFLVEAEEDGAALRLNWSGNALSMGQLESWLDEPLDGVDGEIPARFVLTRHGTEAWPVSHGEAEGICIPLPLAAAEPDHTLRGSVYDFSLFEKSRVASLAETPLDDLAYVVFDTETTGLLPTQGDEIVQVAALRLIGDRLVEGEEFDRLVDPGRPIPAASTKVHGITEEMVGGQPDIGEIGKLMHEFADGAVLVAHNAPFDMAFFHKHRDVIGKEFDNPVLDTVLLSSVLFGITAPHTLDALCDRLGIEIPEELRHTAMGDTRATAEAFRQMLIMLKDQGYQTFGDVHAEMKKQTRLYRRA